MNLSKEEIKQLRDDGDITTQEFVRLMAKAQDAPDEEEQEPEDESAKALNRIADTVEKIGSSIPKEDNERNAIAPILSDIRVQLKDIAEETKLANDSRQRQWVFIPQYDRSGRIEKITVE